MPTAPRKALDRAAIVTAALEILDRVGYDKLSTRALADHLGVKSPALYWHFKNKQELLDAMAEAIHDATPWPGQPAPGDDPGSWLRDRANVFRRSLLAYRDGARVHAGSRPTQRQLPEIEAQIAALVAAGFAVEDAARTVLAVSRFTVGWVLEEQASAQRADGPPELGGLPALRTSSATFLGRYPDEDFAFGLDALVDGSLRGSRSSPTP